jgi:hypothetical protein
MLELNGLKYARKEFADYKIRAKVKFKIVNDEHPTFIDIYTTDTDKANVEKVLNGRKSEKVLSLEIVHVATKEQDDAISEIDLLSFLK